MDVRARLQAQDAWGKPAYDSPSRSASTAASPSEILRSPGSAATFAPRDPISLHIRPTGGSCRSDLEDQLSPRGFNVWPVAPSTHHRTLQRSSVQLPAQKECAGASARSSTPGSCGSGGRDGAKGVAGGIGCAGAKRASNPDATRAGSGGLCGSVPPQGQRGDASFALPRKSNSDNLESRVSRTSSGEPPEDVLIGFIPEEAYCALKRLQARLDAVSALGMSQEEAIERGMIPGLELKRFEEVARRLQALGQVGISVERGQQMGLVEADVMEVYENFLAQFETLETLGMSYEEGVQMGFIQDGVRRNGISSFELQKAPGAEGVHCSSLADLELPKASSAHATSSTTAPSIASSLPSRQDCVHDRKKVAAPAHPQQSGFTFRVGPDGILCACGAPPRSLDEHEIEEVVSPS